MELPDVINDVAGQTVVYVVTISLTIVVLARLELPETAPDTEAPREDGP